MGGETFIFHYFLFIKVCQQFSLVLCIYDSIEVVCPYCVKHCHNIIKRRVIITVTTAPRRHSHTFLIYSIVLFQKKKTL